LHQSANGSIDETAVNIGRLNGIITDLYARAPTYIWLTAFNQLLSRIGHTNAEIYVVLHGIICGVVNSYTQQAVWSMVSVSNSSVEIRAQRCRSMFNMFKVFFIVMVLSKSSKNSHVGDIVIYIEEITQQLRQLCNYETSESRRLKMTENFNELMVLTPTPIIIPLQSSLTARLPTTTQDFDSHHPYQTQLPTIHSNLLDYQ